MREQDHVGTLWLKQAVCRVPLCDMAAPQGNWTPAHSANSINKLLSGFRSMSAQQKHEACCGHNISALRASLHAGQAQSSTASKHGSRSLDTGASHSGAKPHAGAGQAENDSADR